VALDALSASGQNDAIAESVRTTDSVRTRPATVGRLPRVIVVVEGPSGAGKATWPRQVRSGAELFERLLARLD
jgi:hypothetical protein